jgi:hypothetical protein
VASTSPSSLMKSVGKPSCAGSASCPRTAARAYSYGRAPRVAPQRAGRSFRHASFPASC